MDGGPGPGMDPDPNIHTKTAEWEHTVTWMSWSQPTFPALYPFLYHTTLACNTPALTEILVIYPEPAVRSLPGDISFSFEI